MRISYNWDSDNLRTHFKKHVIDNPLEREGWELLLGKGYITQLETGNDCYINQYRNESYKTIDDCIKKTLYFTDDSKISINFSKYISDDWEIKSCTRYNSIVSCFTVGRKDVFDILTLIKDLKFKDNKFYTDHIKINGPDYFNDYLRKAYYELSLCGKEKNIVSLKIGMLYKYLEYEISKNNNIIYKILFSWIDSVYNNKVKYKSVSSSEIDGAKKICNMYLKNRYNVENSEKEITDGIIYKIIDITGLEEKIDKSNSFYLFLNSLENNVNKNVD